MMIFPIQFRKEQGLDDYITPLVNIAGNVAVGGLAIIVFTKLGVLTVRKLVSQTDTRTASVLPYAITSTKIDGVAKEQIQFLIAQVAQGFSKNTWSDFGGYQQDCRERTYVTAARQCAEESRGILGDLHTLAPRIRNCPVITFKKIWQTFPERCDVHELFLMRVDEALLTDGRLQNIEDIKSDFEMKRTHWISREELLAVARGRGKFKIGESDQFFRDSFMRILESSKAQRVMEQIGEDPSSIPERTHIKTHLKLGHYN